MPEDELADEAQPEFSGIVIQAGGVVPTANDRWSAPTIQADAIQGAMISPWMVKISFIEHFLANEENQLQGRYVANLVMPTPQLRAMADLFSKLADQTDQQMQSLVPSGE